jgi:Pyridoxamine 5'-phosphate oxidase
VDNLGTVRRETLSREACVARLAASDLARVVVSVRCLPVALPARICVVDDQRLLLASPEAAVLTAAARGEVLSVQVDGQESDGATWSVMASGIARTAPTDVSLDQRLRAAVARGASVVELPLSVVVGEKVG